MKIFNKVNLFFTHVKQFFSYLFCSIEQYKEGDTYAYSLYRKANLAELTALEQKIAEDDPEQSDELYEMIQAHSMDYGLNYPCFLEHELWRYEKTIQILARAMTILFILSFVNALIS